MRNQDLPSPSRRWRKWRLLTICFALVALLYHTMRPEAVYRGQSLEYWFADQVVRAGDGEGMLAFREAGSAAVPYLLNKLAERESTWKAYYRSRWSEFPVLQAWLPKPANTELAALRAAILLGEIGPDARAAAPTLMRLLRTEIEKMEVHQRKQDSSPPGSALDFPLSPRLSSPPRSNSRTNAVVLMPENDGGYWVLIENSFWFFRGVETSDWAWEDFGENLVRALSRIGSDDPEIVPLFLKIAGSSSRYSLAYTSAFDAFGRPHFDAALKASVPALRRALGSEDELTRRLAFAGLCQIAPGDDSAAQILARHFSSLTEPREQTACLQALARNGRKYLEAISAQIPRTMSDE